MVYDYVCIDCKFLYQDGLGNCYCSNPNSPSYKQIIMNDKKSINIAHCDFAADDDDDGNNHIKNVTR